VGSNPTQIMDVWCVYVFILCLCCPCDELFTRPRSPTVRKMIMKLKNQRSWHKGAAEPMKNIMVMSSSFKAGCISASKKMLTNSWNRNVCYCVQVPHLWLISCANLCQSTQTQPIPLYPFLAFPNTSFVGGCISFYFLVFNIRTRQ
jgi:hypothetical protein